jgi:hypothetical protein
MNYDEITSRLARGGELIWVPYVSSSMKVKPLDFPMLLIWRIISLKGV